MHVAIKIVDNNTPFGGGGGKLSGFWFFFPKKVFLKIFKF